MVISQNDWENYIAKMRKLSETAANKFQEYVDKYGFEDRKSLIDYAYALVTKYGEGEAYLAAQMYDEIAELSGVTVESAIPAPTATYGETAKAINGSLKQSKDGKLLNQVAYRLTKQAGADTSLQNAIRDRAEWAWVPMGDTCAFCITLASRGWQTTSRKMLKGAHAEHIHANCDCQFAVRFDKKSGVKGYDPDKYLEMYKSAEGRSSAEKMKSLRKQLEDRDKINAQKRDAYSNKKYALTEKQSHFIMELENIPSVISRRNPSELKDYLNEIGFEIKPLSRGSLKNVNFEDGGGYKVNYSGDGYIQYHPSTDRHHKGAYYKVSSAKNGTHRYNINGEEIK